ncbi:MAG: phosphatase PAP2 family protein [Bacilli bacterium]|nr:phosphatase PAP2 family protein [Bacilli bacterium]
MISKVERIIVYAVLTSFFILAIPFDLSITQGLYQPDNVFGKAFELLGEVPLYIVAAFALSLLCLYHPNQKQWVDRFLFLLFLALAIGVSAYSGNHTYKLLVRNGLNVSGGAVSWIIRLGIGAAVFAVGFLPARFLFQKANPRECFLFGIFAISCFAASVLLMQGLKMIWLRPRYRTLVALQEVGAIPSANEHWLPFYMPQFFTSFAKYEAGGEYGFTAEQIAGAMERLHITEWGQEEFYSFPSGHSMNSMMALTLFPLLNLFPGTTKGKRYPLICRIVVYVFATTVAFSRILRGAHNATDVTTGLLLGFLIVDFGTAFLYERFLRKRFVIKTEE